MNSLTGEDLHKLKLLLVKAEQLHVRYTVISAGHIMHSLNSFLWLVFFSCDLQFTGSMALAYCVVVGGD